MRYEDPEQYKDHLKAKTWLANIFGDNAVDGDTGLDLNQNWN